MLLEISAYSLDDAIRAETAGAHRIELCSDAATGGVTPSAGTIQTAREHLRIPLFVIIRPRPGSFVYSDAEFASMRRDIEICKSLKVDGVVLGLLTANNDIDRDRTAQLVELARPMEVTFHRAFDLTPNPLRALEQVIASGCSRLLTSGHHSTALEGATEIASLVSAARGKIVIMPGAGVRSSNIAELARRTGAAEFHSSARTTATRESGLAQSFAEPQRLDPAEIEALRDIAASSSGIR